MRYKFDLIQQTISGLIAFLVAVLVTFLFGKQVNWALALAVGVGAFFTTDFYNKTEN